MYKDTFQTLTQAIHSARLGHLHPSLLTTNSLQNIIRQINYIHPGYEFPIPIMHARTDKLSEIASVKLGFRENNFLAEIRIPLLNKFATEVYRMHPVPIPQQHQDHLVSAYIQPQAQYISLSHDKRSYSFLTQNNLNQCKHNLHYRICTHNQPIHEPDHNKACEYLLLNQPSEDNIKKCGVKLLPNFQPYWIHLDSLDGWLFSVNKPSTLQILCPGEQHNLTTISGVGIVQLKPRCFARHEHTTMVGMKTLGYSSEFIYVPQLKLNVTTIDNEFFIKYQSLNKTLIMPRILGKHIPENLHTSVTLDSIQDQYDEFLVKQSEIKLRSDLMYSTIGSYIIGTIIVIFIIVNCTKHFRCIPWTKEEEPKPTTRSGSYEFDVLRPINVTEHPPHALRNFSGMKDTETHDDVSDHSVENEN